jgi:serine/threonine protein kinase
VVQVYNVAVKVLNEECMSVAKFVREAEVMQTLTHPNILQILAVKTDADPIYLVTEFMDEGDLIKYMYKYQKKVKKRDRRRFYFCHSIRPVWHGIFKGEVRRPLPSRPWNPWNSHKAISEVDTCRA